MDTRFVVADAFRAMAAELEEFLAEQLGTIRLDPAELRILRALKKRHDEGFNPQLADFARIAGIAKSTMSKYVYRLTIKGFIRRTLHPRDKRSLGVALSEEGEAVLVAADAVDRRVAEEFFGDYKEHEIEQLHELLIAYFDH